MSQTPPLGRMRLAPWRYWTRRRLKRLAAGSSDSFVAVVGNVQARRLPWSLLCRQFLVLAFGDAHVKVKVVAGSRPDPSMIGAPVRVSGPESGVGPVVVDLPGPPPVLVAGLGRPFDPAAVTFMQAVGAALAALVGAVGRFPSAIRALSRSLAAMAVAVIRGAPSVVAILLAITRRGVVACGRSAADLLRNVPAAVRGLAANLAQVARVIVGAAAALPRLALKVAGALGAVLVKAIRLIAIAAAAVPRLVARFVVALGVVLATALRLIAKALAAIPGLVAKLVVALAAMLARGLRFLLAVGVAVPRVVARFVGAMAVPLAGGLRFLASMVAALPRLAFRVAAAPAAFARRVPGVVGRLVVSVAVAAAAAIRATARFVGAIPGWFGRLVTGAGRLVGAGVRGMVRAASRLPGRFAALARRAAALTDNAAVLFIGPPLLVTGSGGALVVAGILLPGEDLVATGMVAVGAGMALVGAAWLAARVVLGRQLAVLHQSNWEVTGRIRWQESRTGPRGLARSGAVAVQVDSLPGRPTAVLSVLPGRTIPVLRNDEPVTLHYRRAHLEGPAQLVAGPVTLRGSTQLLGPYRIHDPIISGQVRRSVWRQTTGAPLWIAAGLLVGLVAWTALSQTAAAPILLGLTGLAVALWGISRFLLWRSYHSVLHAGCDVVSTRCIGSVARSGIRGVLSPVQLWLEVTGAGPAQFLLVSVPPRQQPLSIPMDEVVQVYSRRRFSRVVLAGPGGDSAFLGRVRRVNDLNRVAEQPAPNARGYRGVWAPPTARPAL